MQDRINTKDLDSSLKRISAFKRKLSKVTSENVDSIISDFSTINISKYLTEICLLLCTTSIAIGDIPSLVKVFLFYITDFLY
jgi:hypothetical protein